MSKYNTTTDIGFMAALGAVTITPLKASALTVVKVAEALPVVLDHVEVLANQANFALRRAEQELFRSYSDALGRRVGRKDFDTDEKCEKLAEEMAFADWEDPSQDPSQKKDEQKKAE